MTCDSLDTDMWICHGGNVVDVAKNRFRLHSFPGVDECLLHNSFTFIGHPQQGQNENRNQLLWKLSGGLASWRGDLLVIKHHAFDPEEVVTATISDLALVNLISTRYSYLSDRYIVLNLMTSWIQGY